LMDNDTHQNALDVNHPKQADGGVSLMNISKDKSVNLSTIGLVDGKNTVGTHQKSSILLKGLGIAEHHATMTINKDKTVTVTPLDPDMSKVVVNGKVVMKKTQLSHCDRVTFGYGNSFKIVFDNGANNSTIVQDITDYSTIMKDRINADTEEADNIKMYLKEIESRIGKSKTDAFAKAFEQALDELDEVDEYTKYRYMTFPLDKNFIYYATEVMVDVKEFNSDEPEVAIRCRHRRTEEVQYLWRYVHFQKRLQKMREWYDDIAEDGIVNDDSLIDPWMNISEDDIKRKQEMQLRDFEDKVRNSKKKLIADKEILDEAKKEKEDALIKIEENLSPGELKDLPRYIQIELLKRNSKDGEEKMVKDFNEKGDEFRLWVATYHSNDVKRSEKVLENMETEKRIKKLDKQIAKLKGEKPNSQQDDKVTQQRAQLRKLIKVR